MFSLSELETELPIEFIDELQSDTGPSEQYLINNAPWLRLTDETDYEYQLFQLYQTLPQHTWDIKKAFKELDIYFESGTIERPTFKNFSKLATQNNWYIRRYSYILYSDWLMQREDIRQQLMTIADYRRNQSELAQSASIAGLKLMDKVMEKIDDIDFDEIRTQDIPKFLSAIKDITNLAADAEARLLSISVLLDLHSKEIAEMFEEGMEL